MLCYKDRTYCASKTHKGCGRKITKAELADAKMLGLPIAWSYFCGEPTKSNLDRSTEK
jgi:hypothetical protein